MNTAQLVRLTAILLILTWAMSALGQDEPALNSVEATATVLGLIETSGEACGPPAKGKGHGLWGLKPGSSKFRFSKKTETVHRIKLLTTSGGEDADMEVASFFAFNKNKSPMIKPACGNGDSLTEFPFAFAIHDIEDSHKPNTKSPHALIYVPSRRKPATPVNLADSFDLLVYSIEKDASDCTSPDPVVKARCLALRRLADLKGTVEEIDFIVAIWGAIDTIRPPGRPPKPPFHNGIIHGSLH
jgi:hypothetical protein